MKKPLAGKKAFYAQGFSWAAHGGVLQAHATFRFKHSWAFFAFQQGFIDGRHSQRVELMKSKSIPELIEACK